MTQVILLNGGSSSGKSSIARALQDILPELWLTFGVDVLAEALPGRGDDPRSGLVLEPDGTVTVTPGFRALEDIWYHGLAFMVSRGAFLILDEVLLTGGAGQQRLQTVLTGLDVLWAGVHCDPLVAAEREAGRPERIRGMAMTQAAVVHAGVTYDVEVDTTNCPALTCARQIAEASRATRPPGRCHPACDADRPQSRTKWPPGQVTEGEQEST
jgi:chloramphenicol 3-O phosphotransferase